MQRNNGRFTANELITVAEALEIPEKFVTRSGYAFARVEAFALLCARLRSSADQHILVIQFNRSQAAISSIVNELAMFLDEKWKHLLDFDTSTLLARPALEEYADAVHQFGAPAESVFGFIDCTIRRICRPKCFQRVAYNGHKKYHAIKFQAVMLPNGMFGHLFGPYEGRRNDNLLLDESGLLQKLEGYAVREEDYEGEDTNFQGTLQLFGDPAYGVGPHLISPFV